MTELEITITEGKTEVTMSFEGPGAVRMAVRLLDAFDLTVTAPRVETHTIDGAR